MFIYVFLLLVCYIFALINNKYKDNRKLMKISYMIIVLFMIIVVGCRNDKVGIDTVAYKNEFIRLGEKDYEYLKNYEIFEEIGYAFSNILFAKLGLTWEIYKLIMAAMFLIPVFYLIYKKAENPFYSLVFFVTMGWLTYPMSTVRQAVAIGLSVLAFLCEENNKKLSFVICIFLAISFHNSAFIVLIYWMVLKIPLNKKNIKMWWIIGVLTLILGTMPLRSFVQKIMLYFGKNYSNAENVGGNLTELLFVVTLIIGGITLNKKEDEVYTKFYKAVYLSAIILPIIRIHPALFRVYQYFSIYMVTFIPKVLSKIKDCKIQILGHICYNLVGLYFLFSSILIELNKTVPYIFFWD